MKVIDIRRSIRKYKDQPVEKEKVEKILRAAMQAPSAGNQQPWEFIVIENKERLKELSGMCRYSRPIVGSPLTIVLLGSLKRMKYAECWEQDLGAATENMLLEAVELDLGAVWMAIAPFEERMEYVRRLFVLPEFLMPYAAVSIGYSDKENHYIDRFDSERIHYEEW